MALLIIELYFWNIAPTINLACHSHCLYHAGNDSYEQCCLVSNPVIWLYIIVLFKHALYIWNKYCFNTFPVYSLKSHYISVYVPWSINFFSTWLKVAIKATLHFANIVWSFCGRKPRCFWHPCQARSQGLQHTMGLYARYKRTTKAHTSLRIHTVWSAPLLFAIWREKYL